MSRRLHPTFLLAPPILLATACLGSAAAPVEGQGTYLGALIAPVSRALYDQLPQLPRQQGVLITRVLPESPAAAAALHANDILLTYDGKLVRDCEHLARLIRDDMPGRKLKVTYLRAGHESSTLVTLARGPALIVAEAKAGSGQPRAANKPGSPASVNVGASLLDNGKLKVTIEYFPEGSKNAKTVTWEGDPADLDGAVRALPERERQLARHALDRLRTLNAPKTPAD
jgi:PDZ domain